MMIVPKSRAFAAFALVAAAAAVAGPSALAQDPTYEIPPPTFEPPANPPFKPPVITDPGQPGFLRPFPIVRIKGMLTPRGARITRLSVRAPKGTRVRVRCKRRGCPPKRLIARTAMLLRFRAYERNLRAGVRITITATKAGLIGKHVVITIRKGSVPKRLDRCLMPGEKVPIACPQA